MSKHVNLWDSDVVNKYVQRAEWTNGYKNNVLNAYVDWCKFKGFDFMPRKFSKEEKLPFVPLERDINQLIAGCGPKLACFLQLLKESGFRPIEASRLTPEDFDLE